MPIALILLFIGFVLIVGGVKNYSITGLLTGRVIDRGGGDSPSPDSSVYQDPTGSGTSGNPTNSTGKKFGSGILDTIGKIIGLPYQGTHAKDFNVRGGSDNWQSENAVDISLPVGTPVYSPVSGTVVRAGPLPGNPGGRFAGQRVTVQGSNNAFYFAHLSAVSVSVGQKISAGTILGNSGSANGVDHLHFAVENGSPLDWLIPRKARPTNQG